MNTKGLNGDDISRYVRMLNMQHQEGRSELAPEVHLIINKERCGRFNSTSSKVTRRVRNTQDLSKPINNLGRPEHYTVSESHGGCDLYCGCYGCWMFCDGNERS